MRPAVVRLYWRHRWIAPAAVAVVVGAGVVVGGAVGLIVADRAWSVHDRKVAQR